MQLAKVAAHGAELQRLVWKGLAQAVGRSLLAVRDRTLLREVRRVDTALAAPRAVSRNGIRDITATAHGAQHGQRRIVQAEACTKQALPSLSLLLNLVINLVISRVISLFRGSGALAEIGVEDRLVVPAHVL